jgi:hypothetical protein
MATADAGQAGYLQPPVAISRFSWKPGVNRLRLTSLQGTNSSSKEAGRMDRLFRSAVLTAITKCRRAVSQPLNL